MPHLGSAPAPMTPASLRIGAVVAAAAACLGGYRATKLLRGEDLGKALRLMQLWSRFTCRCLRIRVLADGQLESARSVVVANHRSYLDIPVLSAALGTTFVSRDDVAGWPIVGAAAHEVGAVFVDRDETHARVRAARALARRLRDSAVVVFPEGTTHGERLPAPFQAGLFRLLHRLGATTVPVTIRYSSRDLYWVEELSLSQHLRQHVLPGRAWTAAVHVGAPIAAQACAGPDDLLQRTYAAVCQPIEDAGETVVPGLERSI